MAKIYTLKDKRMRIDWRSVLFDTESKVLEQRFYAFKALHPGMSENRCAYYVMKKSYSTTTIQIFVDRVHSNFGRANPKWFFPVLIEDICL